MEFKDMDKENNLENINGEEIHIGSLLRSEREKKGISGRSLAEIIKIREPLIDALENEDWEKLPARVFIKGFIRSYTIAIGYDTKKALRLFNKCMPLKGEDSPKTLTHRTKKGQGIYYIIALLLLIAITIYFLRNHLKSDNTSDSPQPVSEPSAITAPAAEVQPEVRIDTPVQTQVKPVTEIPAPGPDNEPAAQGEAEGETTTAKTDEITGAIPPEPVAPRSDQTVQNTTPDVSPSPENPSVEKTEVTPTALNTPETQSLTGKELTATINERTWVKIIADDTEPKEYIFQPGAKHTWAAERGFVVTVGNAGGIEFSFNGETIKNIGEIGEVKKLRFPDDFQTKLEE
jgi:cytoskeleton protein RodZ